MQIRTVLTKFRILYTKINVNRLNILTEKEVKLYLLIITTLPLLPCGGGRSSSSSSSTNKCAVMVWNNGSGDRDY